MVGARPRRYREGPSHWVLTPIAVSLLIHALVLHFFPAIDLTTPEAIRERLRETFYMADFSPLVPAIVEAVERAAGILPGEEIVEMNATGAVGPLGSAVLDVQPAQPPGIVQWPAVPDETLEQPQGPPPLSPLEVTEPSRRLLADTHPQSTPLSPRPVFLSRYRNVEPGPEAGFAAPVMPVSDGDPVGGAWASGGAEFIGHGTAPVGGEQLALGRPGVPGG